MRGEKVEVTAFGLVSLRCGFLDGLQIVAGSLDCTTATDAGHRIVSAEKQDLGYAYATLLLTRRVSAQSRSLVDVLCEWNWIDCREDEH